LGEVTGLPIQLPTEAQWEYAARSRGQALQFATDNGKLDFGRNSWDRKTGRYNDVVSVGSYPPNPLGIHDMTGNANEWVNDWYSPLTYGDYEGPEQVDPTGPVDGDIWNTRKMSRGFGRQHSDPTQINVFARLPTEIDYTAGNGFRCSIQSNLTSSELKKLMVQARK
jgi:formylglycine-generating enzyme required for sulfatase activity